MRYHAEDRPKLPNGRPRLIWNHAALLAVVPSLCITQTAEDNLVYLVEVMIVIAPNTARWFSIDVDEANLGHFIQQYYNFPEHVLHECFGWSYTPDAQMTSKSGIGGKEVLTLSDLGL